MRSVSAGTEPPYGTCSMFTGDRHRVSANASKTKPAKLLAVFVVDTNETELTIPFGTGY
jgi:hypothetical protein